MPIRHTLRRPVIFFYLFFQISTDNWTVFLIILIFFFFMELWLNMWCMGAWPGPAWCEECDTGAPLEINSVYTHPSTEVDFYWPKTPQMLWMYFAASCMRTADLWCSQCRAMALLHALFSRPLGSLKVRPHPGGDVRHRRYGGFIKVVTHRNPLSQAVHLRESLYLSQHFMPLWSSQVSALCAAMSDCDRNCT